MGFITMLSREAGKINYGTRMIEQDRINLSVQVDLGNCSQEEYVPTTDVTEVTDSVIWFENNFYIPTGVTTFTFTEGITEIVATLDGTWSFDTVVQWTPEHSLPDAEKEVEGWYDSADGVTASSPLTRWANKKTHVNALPDYINDAFNPPDYFAETEHFNKNVIRFTEGNNEMIQWETNPELSQPFVIFICFRNRRPTNYTSSWNKFVYDARVGARSSLAFNDTGVYQISSGSPSNVGSYDTDVTVYTGKHNSPSSSFKFNDGDRFTDRDIGTNGLGAMCLGNDNNGSDTPDVDIAEVIISLSDLSENDMQTIETYLNNKYRP